MGSGQSVLGSKYYYLDKQGLVWYVCRVKDGRLLGSRAQETYTVALNIKPMYVVGARIVRRAQYDGIAVEGEHLGSAT